jgi:hypothetical protein
MIQEIELTSLNNTVTGFFYLGSHITYDSFQRIQEIELTSLNNTVTGFFYLGGYITYGAFQ